jgi:predicted amidohydrolase YtcJ
MAGVDDEVHTSRERAGKIADLVILDRNPLKVDPDEIRNITVVETIKRGKTIHRSD